jgi:DNA-binding LacI/PurR family transcriptional regulator
VNDAYKDTLRSNGIEIDPGLITPAADWMDMDSIKEFIAGKAGSFDGIVSVSDYKAITALEEPRRAGLRVPEDIAVVGFDNDPGGRVLSRPLTTIEPDHVQVAVHGLDLLLDASKVTSPSPRTLFLHGLSRARHVDAYPLASVAHGGLV